MKLLFHIGTEKTGTSSLQQWAAANREGLQRQGVFYSRVLGPVNHIGIYLWALPPETDDEGFFQLGLQSLEQRQAFRARLPGQLAAEIEEAREKGCHTFLISNEHCHSRLRKPEHLYRLHGLLVPLFDQIRILGSFRPQVDMAVSLASTASRGFLRIDRAFFNRIVPKDLYYNYDQLEQRWREVFGAEVLDFVAFRKTPDTVAEVARRLNLNMDALQPPVRHNEALDVQTMAMSNALGQFARTPGSAFNKQARLPLDKLSCVDKLQPGLELAREVQARFTESNAAFAARCPGIDPEDLEPDWSKYEAPSNLDILDQDCAFVDRLAELLMVLNARITLGHVREKLAETERALAMNNMDNASRFLTRAEEFYAVLPKDMDIVRPAFETRMERLRARIAAGE